MSDDKKSSKLHVCAYVAPKWPDVDTTDPILNYIRFIEDKSKPLNGSGSKWTSEFSSGSKTVNVPFPYSTPGLDLSTHIHTADLVFDISLRTASLDSPTIECSISPDDLRSALTGCKDGGCHLLIAPLKIRIGRVRSSHWPADRASIQFTSARWSDDANSKHWIRKRMVWVSDTGQSKILKTSALIDLNTSVTPNECVYTADTRMRLRDWEEIHFASNRAPLVPAASKDGNVFIKQPREADGKCPTMISFYAATLLNSLDNGFTKTKFMSITSNDDFEISTRLASDLESKIRNDADVDEYLMNTSNGFSFSMTRLDGRDWSIGMNRDGIPATLTIVVPMTYLVW